MFFTGCNTSRYSSASSDKFSLKFSCSQQAFLLTLSHFSYPAATSTLLSRVYLEIQLPFLYHSNQKRRTKQIDIFYISTTINLFIRYQLSITIKEFVKTDLYKFTKQTKLPYKTFQE